MYTHICIIQLTFNIYILCIIQLTFGYTVYPNASLRVILNFAGADWIIGNSVRNTDLPPKYRQPNPIVRHPSIDSQIPL